MSTKTNITQSGIFQLFLWLVLPLCTFFGFFWWMTGPHGAEAINAANAAALAKPTVVGRLPDGREISCFTIHLDGGYLQAIYVVNGSTTITTTSTLKHSETQVTVINP